MTEIILSFIQILVFVIIFSFPFNIFAINNSYKKYNLNIYDVLLINVTIHLTFLLFCSFFLINQHLIFFLQLVLGLFSLGYYFKDYFNFIKKNHLLLIFYLSINFCLFIAIIWNPILTWDGVSHWFFKTQVFYQGGGYTDLKGLTYDYYPHLGSYVWAFFWKNSILQYEYFGRFYYVFLFITVIFSITENLKKTFSNNEIILITLFLVFLTTDNFLFGGYQEYLLFVIFYIISRIFLILQKSNNTNLYVLIFYYMVSFLFLWIKQEGFFYFIISGMVLVIYFQKNLNEKFLASFFLILLLIFYIIIRTYFHDSFHFNEKVTINNLFDKFSFNVIGLKVFYIFKYFIISVFKYPIWLLIFISCFFLYKMKYFARKKYLVLFSVINLMFIGAIYLYSSYEIQWFLSTSLSRILFGISGFYIFLIIDFFLALKKLNIFK